MNANLCLLYKFVPLKAISQEHLMQLRRNCIVQDRCSLNRKRHQDLNRTAHRFLLYIFRKPHRTLQLFIIFLSIFFFGQPMKANFLLQVANSVSWAVL